MFWDYVLSAYCLTVGMLLILAMIIVSKNRHCKAMLAQWDCNEG